MLGWTNYWTNSWVVGDLRGCDAYVMPLLWLVCFRKERRCSSIGHPLLHASWRSIHSRARQTYFSLGMSRISWLMFILKVPKENARSFSPFLSETSFGLRVLWLLASVFMCVSVCVWMNPDLVRAITHYPFKRRSPNLNQRCKTPWLRSLLVVGLHLQGQI